MLNVTEEKINKKQVSLLDPLSTKYDLIDKLHLGYLVVSDKTYNSNTSSTDVFINLAFYFLNSFMH